jgi:tetratricopeptide (TPR) repeat protein
LAVSAPAAWGYCAYDNPYYTTPIVVGDASIDYSQPTVPTNVPDEAYDVSDDGGETTPPTEASQFLDAARDSFIQGDYAAALKSADQAIAKQPGDTVALEVRSLVCFAMKKYKEAAAAAYAVLSVGPGWDWTTQCGFYPDESVYTKQLRELEQYVTQNPNSSEARFVLACQYLTCGYADAAANQWNEVAKLNPKDRLSAQLAKSLTTKESPDAQTAATPPTPAKPVDPASLIGDWKVQQPDGSTISLRLTKDKYTWQFTRQGKTQMHQGPYTVADNLLILKENDSPMMVGQVRLVDNGFVFKLANDNPSDPGLTFTK